MDLIAKYSYFRKYTRPILKNRLLDLCHKLKTKKLSTKSRGNCEFRRNQRVFYTGRKYCKAYAEIVGCIFLLFDRENCQDALLNHNSIILRVIITGVGFAFQELKYNSKERCNHIFLFHNEVKKCLYNARSLGQPTRLNILKHLYLTVKRKAWVDAEIDYPSSGARGFDVVLLTKGAIRRVFEKKKLASLVLQSYHLAKDINNYIALSVPKFSMIQFFCRIRQHRA